MPTCAFTRIVPLPRDLVLPIRSSEVTIKRTHGRRRRSAPTTEPSIKLVVRRGALRRFHKLKQKTAKLPVMVFWDRRQDDRRASSGDIEHDRRKTERRQRPPFTWDLSDFVVAEKANRRTRQTAKKKP
jgi:hypothetical protein